MRRRSLLVGLVAVGAIAVLSVAVATAAAAVSDGGATGSNANAVAAVDGTVETNGGAGDGPIGIDGSDGGEGVRTGEATKNGGSSVAAMNGGSSAATMNGRSSAATMNGGSSAAVGSAADPAVALSIDSTRVAAGDTYESGSDVALTVDAAVGDGDLAGSKLSEIVVRIDDEHFRNVPLNDTEVTRTIETDLRNGDNDVRVIVTDDANNVNATEFTVYKDADPPHLFLDAPYETRPWHPIPDGRVNGTSVTLAGKVIEDSSVESLSLRRDFGDHRETRTVRDVGSNFSFDLELGYSEADSRTNEIHITATDEFGNLNSYSFTLNATDGAAPSVSFRPSPNETSRNRISVAGSVSDDVWIDEANVTLRRPNGNRSGYDRIYTPRSYDLGVDRRTGEFNESLYLIREGPHEVVVNVTDIAGKTTTRTITVDRVAREERDVAPTLEIDRDRTVVLDAETLFLSGTAFEGVVRRLEIETRDADTGETIDYRVVHDGGNAERVSFDEEVAVANRTDVVVRAVDADGEEHAERFTVDGSTREAFVGDEAGGDEGRDPVVSVERLVDGRPGTASSAVSVRHAAAGDRIAIPAANDTDVVTTTRNVTLERVVLDTSAPANLTATVTARERGDGSLSAPPGATAAGTVTLQHSLSGSAVGEAGLVVRVRRAYLDAHGFDAANLTAYRFSDGAWSAVPTRVAETTDASVRYRVDSPGFSVFSLGTDGATLGDGSSDANESDDVLSRDPGTTWPPGNDSAWDPGFDVSDGDADGNSTDGDGDGSGEGADDDGTPDGDGDGTEGDSTDGGSGEASILVTETTVNRTEAGVNESVAVNATLENSGNATGTYVAGLQAIHDVNVSFVEKRSVTVPAGERETVGFVTAFADPGNHTVSVNGTRAGPVTVSEGGGGGGLLSALSILPLELVGMAVGGVLGLGLVLVLVRFVLRRVGGGDGTSG